MKKVIYLICFLIIAAGIAAPPKAEDALKKWSEEQTQKLSSDLNEKGYSYKTPGKVINSQNSSIGSGNKVSLFGIGSAKHFPFSDCCDEYKNIATNQLPNMSENTKLSFIEFDMNGDGNDDFIVKLEAAQLCQEGLCPTYLFVQKDEQTYQKYVGPDVSERETFISDEATDNLRDFIFYQNQWGECIWKWSDAHRQDSFCIIGKYPLREDLLAKKCERLTRTSNNTRNYTAFLGRFLPEKSITSVTEPYGGEAKFVSELFLLNDDREVRLLSKEMNEHEFKEHYMVIFNDALHRSIKSDALEQPIWGVCGYTNSKGQLVHSIESLTIIEKNK